MTTFAWIVIVTLIAGVGGTGLGGFVGVLFKKNSKKFISLLLSFAGGVMLSVVCFDLLQESLSPQEGAPTNVFIVIGGVLLGYLVVALLNRVIDKTTNHEVEHIDEEHPKTADDLDELIHSNHLKVHKENHSSLFVAGIIMAFAIALHNLPEGMVIGAAYAQSEVILGGSGLVMAIIIGLHNIPEGMAVAVPLYAGGMKKPIAVLTTALCGIPTVLGAMLGYWLGNLGQIWLVMSLTFASGAMLYVVFAELLPEAILMWKSKFPGFALLIGILLGLALIYA